MLYLHSIIQLPRCWALKGIAAAAVALSLAGCATPRPQYYDVVTETVVEAPELTAIHIVDRNGMSETISNADRLSSYSEVDFLQPQPYTKVLRVFGKAGTGQVRALITSYYENGQPRQYLEVANNRACGYYREWYDNGQMSIEARVIGGTPDITEHAQATWLFDGMCCAWDEQGRLKAQIAYAKGKLEGESIYYYSSGAIWKRAFFVANEMAGMSKAYYEDGSELQTSAYEHNQPQGLSTRYWHGGEVAAEENYDRGSLISGRYYDREGTCISTVEGGCGFRVVFDGSGVSELHEYLDGQAEGEIQKFDAYGNKIRSWHVCRGIKHGSEVEFYTYPLSAIGEPKLEINWHEGKISGLVKTWYLSGRQESQREMSNNAKNGILTAWYRDGSLMLVEEYENDTLLKGEYYRRGDNIPISEVIDGEGVATLYNGEGHFLRKVNYRDSKPFE